MAKNKVAEIFDGLKESIKESLSPANIMNDIKAELKDQVQHGAHEVASAIFTGGAYVQYARDSHDQQKDEIAHGLSADAKHQPEQEQERGGIEI